MPTLDIFNSDAFSITTMLETINSLPFRPGKIGQLGIFRERGVATTSVAFERLGSTLMLVPTSPRGGNPPTQPRDRRSLISVTAPRLVLQDAIFADEVQNLRAFGTESDVQSVEGLLRDRLETATANLDQTLEWHRAGAIKGQVLDADGVSVVLDIYSVHGVSKQTELDFDLDNPSPATGALMGSCNTVIRQTEDELGAVPYTGIHCYAGKNFMEDLVRHPQYLETYQATDAAQLRNRTVGIQVQYGGITFEEYRGQVNGVRFIDDNKAVFFPIGVPNLFQTVFVPADYEETVNTVGIPRYFKQWGDGGPGRRREFEVQTNPINFCSRPRVVQFARRT